LARTHSSKNQRPKGGGECLEMKREAHKRRE
jgi:hypothetical protein